MEARPGGSHGHCRFVSRRSQERSFHDGPASAKPHFGSIIRSFPTVYSSLDPHTALDEVLAHFRYHGFPIESAMPRVTVSVRARLVRVLDLTDGKTRSALRVSGRRMLDEPWREAQKAGREALTQAPGRIGQELGWEAFLVPSAARRGGMNLIISPTNLARRSSLDIINVGEWPRRG